jgi:hypothetical protein
MEGGVAIFLLFVLVGVIALVVIGFWVLGGALGLRRRSDAKQESSGDRGRPVHKRPTTPAHENTRFVGSEQDRERVDRH